jgi:hypothetical protein
MKIRQRTLSGFVVCLLVLTCQASVTRAERLLPQAPPTLSGCPIFPADNIWNVPVDTLPVDANSSAYVNAMGATTNVHADFGSGEWPPGSGSPIGIPFVVVPPSQPLVPINWTAYGDESDPGPYPVPPTAPIEGGPNSDGDRHVLVLRQGECKLYELYRAFPNGAGWDADSGAVYTMTVNGPLRPATWTSADAAGLPILPGLVRYDEVASGEIDHAVRFTSNTTRAAYVWPARHQAPYHSTPNSPPMGQRFRLKASFVIDNRFSPETQVILRALKKYGMILADNGSSWYISGAPDERWNNDVLHELDVVKGSDFEAVDESSLMVDPNSAQAVQGFVLSATPATRAIAPGGAATYLLTLTPGGGFSNLVTVTAVSPSPNVIVELSSAVLTPPGQTTLILTDTHPAGTLMPGLWYSVPITATGGGVTQNATVGLLVGGVRVYLPLFFKNAP